MGLFPPRHRGRQLPQGAARRPGAQVPGGAVPGQPHRPPGPHRAQFAAGGPHRKKILRRAERPGGPDLYRHHRAHQGGGQLRPEEGHQAVQLRLPVHRERDPHVFPQREKIRPGRVLKRAHRHGQGRQRVDDFRHHGRGGHHRRRPGHADEEREALWVPPAGPHPPGADHCGAALRPVRLPAPAPAGGGPATGHQPQLHLPHREKKPWKSCAGSLARTEAGPLHFSPSPVQ